MSRTKTALRIILPIFALAACDRISQTVTPPAAEPNTKAETAPEIVIPVQVEPPIRGSISSNFETTSRVEAEKRVQVVAESVGECKKIHVEEGDAVKAGDVLAELDTTEMLATIGQAEVQVRQTRTAYERAMKMEAEGIGAPAERENAKFAYDQALATLNMHKVQLDKLTVRAPISGIITKRSVVLGQVVANGTPLFQIVDPNSFILTINPPEKELARLQLNQVAKVTIDALGNDEFQATVRRINPGIDPAYGTIKVVLEFAEKVRQRLRESAFARVRLVMDTHENALLVPKDALVEENARKYLFIIEEDARKEEPAVKEASVSPSASDEAAASSAAEKSKSDEPKYIAKRVEVETGLEDSDHVEILSGISDNVRVVTLGQHTLKPGSKVTVTEARKEVGANLAMDADEALKKAKERSANEIPEDNQSSRRRRHP